MNENVINFTDDEIRMMLFEIRQYEKKLDFANEDDTRVLDFLRDLKMELLDKTYLDHEKLHMLLLAVSKYDRTLSPAIDDNYEARVMNYNIKMKLYEGLKIDSKFIFDKNPAEEVQSKKR